MLGYITPPTKPKYYMPYRVVAASDASDESKKKAHYVCDGSHDEEEIAQAVADINSAGGGILFLTEGSFNIHNQLNISDVEVVGSGPNTKIYTRYNGTNIRTSGNVRIENLSIYCIDQNYNYHVENTSKLEMYGVSISGKNKQYYVYNNGGDLFFINSKIHFGGGYKYGSYGIYSTGNLYVFNSMFTSGGDYYAKNPIRQSSDGKSVMIISNNIDVYVHSYYVATGIYIDNRNGRVVICNNIVRRINYIAATFMGSNAFFLVSDNMFFDARVTTYAENVYFFNNFLSSYMYVVMGNVWMYGNCLNDRLEIKGGNVYLGTNKIPSISGKPKIIGSIL